MHHGVIYKGVVSNYGGGGYKTGGGGVKFYPCKKGVGGGRTGFSHDERGGGGGHTSLEVVLTQELEV